jgi:pimeloyl-ACP methyl ester carboxylesterase
MATTMVNGVELYYETTGTGDCLVLTHGSWADGTGWDRVVAGLAERYRVVVWDRRVTPVARRAMGLAVALRMPPISRR